MATGWPVFLSLPFLTTANPAPSKAGCLSTDRVQTARRWGSLSFMLTSNSNSCTYLVAVQKVLDSDCRSSRCALRAGLTVVDTNFPTSTWQTFDMDFWCSFAAGHSLSSSGDRGKTQRHADNQPRKFLNNLTGLRLSVQSRIYGAQLTSNGLPAGATSCAPWRRKEVQGSP